MSDARTPPEPELTWDTSSVRTGAATVVATRAGGQDITLSFGMTRNEAGEVGIRLERKIAMPLLSAKSLRDMLRNLIADADAAQKATET